jgi:hypothetical protein
MRSVAFPYAARILGVLAVVLEVCVVVVYVLADIGSWLFLWPFLGGGVAAVVALGCASQVEPRGDGKRPAIVALILMAAYLGLVVLFFLGLIFFSSGG